MVLEVAPYRPVRCLCDKDCFGLPGATPQSHATVKLASGQTWVVPRWWLDEGTPPVPGEIVATRPRWQDRPENALRWGLACWANAAAARAFLDCPRLEET